MQHFSPWQISRLRARLAAYRLNTGRDGKPKTWLDIAQEILDSDATALCLPEADEDPMTEHEPLASDNWKPDQNWPLKGENLRKFVEGERKKGSSLLQPTTLQRNKLQAVHSFLLDVGYLSSMEFREKNQAHHAAYGLMEYFLGEESKPLPIIGYKEARLVTGEFQSRVVSDKNITEREIFIERSGDKSFLLIREVRNIYKNPGNFDPASWGERERKYFFEIRRVLSGWGVFLGLRGLIMFFIKNADDGLEPQVYSSTVVMPQGIEWHNTLVFVRVPLTRIPAVYVQITEKKHWESAFRAVLNVQEIGKDVFLLESTLSQSGDLDDMHADNDVTDQQKETGTEARTPPKGVIVDFRRLKETKRDGR